MKWLVLLAVTALAVSQVVCAQSLTTRIDMSDDKVPSYSIYMQGLPDDIEIWVFNIGMPNESVRAGVVQPLSDNVKAGGYISVKDDKASFNPRVVISGKVANGQALVVADAYVPISGQPAAISLSDAYVVWPISKDWSIGPDINYYKEEGKPSQPRIGGVAKGQIQDNLNGYVRWDHSSKTGSSVRCELSWKF